jgi:hypothetical protein
MSEINVSNFVPDPVFMLVNRYTGSENLRDVLTSLCSKKRCDLALYVVYYVITMGQGNMYFYPICLGSVPVDCGLIESGSDYFIVYFVVEDAESKKDVFCFRVYNDVVVPCSLSDYYLVRNKRIVAPRDTSIAETAI